MKPTHKTSSAPRADRDRGVGAGRMPAGWARWSASFFVAVVLSGAPATPALAAAIDNGQLTSEVPSVEPEDASPDFGSGVLGFLAYLLWHIYRFFPFRDEWFGPALFAGLATAAFRISFWPFLWRVVRHDIRTLSSGKILGAAQHLFAFLVELAGVALFFVFLTSFGRYFQSQPLTLPPGSDTTGGGLLTNSCFAFHVGLLLALAVLLIVVSLRIQQFDGIRPNPYTDRRLVSLFGGGGVYFVYHWGNKVDVAGVLVLTFFWFVGLPLLIVVWLVKVTKAGNDRQKAKADSIWALLPTIPPVAAASVVTATWLVELAPEASLDNPTLPELHLWILLTVTLPWLLNEVARMVFVYIWHRRTFR